MTRNRIMGLTAFLVSASLASGCGSPRAKHLILVTVDTLRADRIGVYGYDAGVTPSLDALARESIRFDRAYAHASLTQPSVASLLTGQLHTQHGVHHNQSDLRDGVPTLAERLHVEGFRTAAFIGSYVLRPGHGLERGFDTYTDAYVSKELLRPIPENPAAKLTDDAIAWIGDQEPGSRMFVWIHYQEPHGPYTPRGYKKPERWDFEPEIPISSSQSGRDAIPKYQWVGHGRLTDYMLRYDGEISEIDWFVGVLRRGLREKGILDDSLLIFTADHGEAFGEDDLYCAHGEGLDESLLRVPLLLRAPGLSPAVRSDVVRQIDVLPTALDILGVEGRGLPGNSLLDDRGDRRVVSQAYNMRLRRVWRGIRDEGVEIVQEKDGPTVVRKLNSDGDSEIPEAVRKRLIAELERESPWPDVGEIPLSPLEKEALRQLGYAE